jgi:Mg2+ and Co2+ transporter CorA
VTVATAMIRIEESQRAMDQNRNFARLTYLAVVFVPLQFVTGFFSMTPDLEQLKTMFLDIFRCCYSFDYSGFGTSTV